MKKYLLTMTLALALPILASATSAVIEIDTRQSEINALEATVRLPKGMNIEEIQTGNSMVLFWITEPALSDDKKSISFAGLTPGGFRGKRAVFKVSGDFDEEDLSGITFTNVRALNNDGEGTRASVKLSASIAESLEDTAKPEPFGLFVGSSPDIFAGKTFVSFAAQDKISGIDYYEAAETYLLRPVEGDWTRTQSPYEVKNATLLKKVYIRATDKAGNIKVGTIWLPNRRYLAGFLAIIFLVLCVILARRSHVRRS